MKTKEALKGNQNASKGGRTKQLSARVRPEVYAALRSMPGTMGDAIERLVMDRMVNIGDV